jgi:hypothetical protein
MGLEWVKGEAHLVAVLPQVGLCLEPAETFGNVFPKAALSLATESEHRAEIAREWTYTDPVRKKQP